LSSGITILPSKNTFVQEPKKKKGGGLHVNAEKSQYMKVSRELGNVPITETISVGQYEFKKVEDFKYLSTIVTQKNECQIEI